MLPLISLLFWLWKWAVYRGMCPDGFLHVHVGIEWNWGLSGCKGYMKRDNTIRVFCIVITNSWLIWISKCTSPCRSSKERSSRDKERSKDSDRTSRDKDRSSRERSPREQKDRKRSYESANGRSEDRRSSEEREAGEI